MRWQLVRGSYQDLGASSNLHDDAGSLIESIKNAGVLNNEIKVTSVTYMTPSKGPGSDWTGVMREFDDRNRHRI
jgi:hypothetical protein